MLWRDFYLSVLLLAVVAASLFATVPSHAESLAERLSGKILLQVEAHGEAWYVYPDTHERYYLGRPDDAFRIMRELSLGISNADLAKIPEAGTTTKGDLALRERLSGKILLQVEANGEAWYVNTETLRRHYMGRPLDAFNLMRELGLGISNLDLQAIPVAEASAPTNGITPVTPSPSANLNDGLDATRQTILTSINTERQNAGLPALTLQHELSLAAQNQVSDMKAKGYIDFTSPTGKTIKEFVAEAGYEAHTLAENLLQTTMAPSSVVSIWKNQGGTSYANVLDNGYEHLGVGAATINGTPVYTIVFSLSLETYFTQQTAALGDIAAVRNAMLTRVNVERSAQGLPPLAMQHLLNLAAQGHADDMLNRSYYAHESPEGNTVFERIQVTGYQAQLVSENIAKNQFSVQQVMDSWMASPGHKANILDPNITEAGFGLAYGKSAEGYVLLWVQNFARPQ